MNMSYRKIMATVLTWTGLLGATPAPADSLALWVAQDPGAELTARVAEFVRRETGLTVTLRPVAARAENPAARAEAYATQRRPGEAVIVVLAAVTNPPTMHLFTFREAGVALVNVPALATEDRERFARRLERQVMRGCAFLLGVEPSPDPFCVLRDYATLDELDDMGRNFSPPVHDDVQRAAAARGVTAIPDDAERPGAARPQP